MLRLIFWTAICSARSSEISPSSVARTYVTGLRQASEAMQLRTNR